MFRDTHFDLQMSTNPQSVRFGVQETLTELCGTVDFSFTVSFPTLFPEMSRVTMCEKKTDAKFLAAFGSKGGKLGS